MTVVRGAGTVGRRPSDDLLLFASAADDPRARRPTDVALAIASVVVLVLISVATTTGADLDAAISDALTAFPPFLDVFWRALAWVPLGWAVVVLGAALVRRRSALARDMLAGVAVAAVIAVALGALVTDDAWSVLTRLLDLEPPPAYPPGAVTITAAALAVASPHVTRPFRHLGRWLLGGQVLGAVFLGATQPSGCVVAIAIGLLAAALVHLVTGSPGGRPTTRRITLALRDLGVDVRELAPSTMHAGGVLRFVGADDVGPLDAKVYGRDAWDAQLLAGIWRLAWYRGTRGSVPLSRLELVEHEAFVTLLAERGGVRVPHLVTAGRAGQGDALIVVRPEGRHVGEVASVSDAALDGLWVELRRLHDAGIAHHRLDLDRVVQRPDGSLGFSDLSSAFVAESVADHRQDEAQALALCLVLAGEERAVAAARRALGDAGTLTVIPYLQAAALPRGVSDALDVVDIDLDDVRNHVRTTLGAEEQQLIRLRRVTAGSLLNLALLAIAAYALISVFSDLDMATFADELRDAKWWWLAFALLLAQLPRVPAAVSTMGSIERPLPFGPLTALQFAICYVNLAIPSTVARVAINVRFFQRFGVPPAMAMTAGVIDSVSGFVTQIVIFLTLFFFATDLDLHLSTSGSDLSGFATVVLIVLGVVLVAAVVVLAVPALRRRLFEAVRQAAGALRVLRSPIRLVQLFGGNLLAQVLFAVAFSATASAFGEELPLSQLLLINTVVSLFAGLLPVPGGMGVTEAGLTLGLTSAGVGSEAAFAIAIAYRFASFYLPPIWGWGAYRWLLQRRYL